MKLPKTILITGANGQAAVHLATELLHQGCDLLLIAHQRTERIDKLVNTYPDKCLLHKCDLGNYEETFAAVQSMVQKSGKIPGGLVHTAAIRSYDAKPLSDSDPETWSKIINQNISMAYNILRCVLPVMTEKKQGKIVIFGSNVTRTGLPYGSAYAAAKSALANLVRSVAWENAAHNIQINMISPAPIDTKLEEDYTGEYLKFRQEYFAAYKNTHPAQQLVAMGDVIKMVLTLLDIEIESVSGDEIFITGGVL